MAEERTVYKVVRRTVLNDVAALRSLYGRGEFSIEYWIGIQVTPPRAHPNAPLLAFDSFTAAMRFAEKESSTIRFSALDTVQVYEARAQVSGPITVVSGFISVAPDDREEELWSEFWARGSHAIRLLCMSNTPYLLTPSKTIGCKWVELEKLIGHVNDDREFVLDRKNVDDPKEGDGRGD